MSRPGSALFILRRLLVLRRFVSLVLVLLVLVTLAVSPGLADSAASPLTDSAAPPAARIVSVAPNPVADGDRGEHLIVDFGTPTNVSGWTIADGESVATFPNRTLDGRVVATTDPDGLPPVDGTVVALGGHLALANAGETIRLFRPSGPVDVVTYHDALEGERYVWTEDGWEWRAPGTTDFPVVRARNVSVRVFVLPDAPGVPFAAIEGANERILLAAYTFSSDRIARALCAANARGVEVRVLVEGEPVGGVSERQGRVLSDLVRCGVRVSALGGPYARYAVHHPKYAVLDDRALVLSENWKPSGVGGRSSRGWGALVDSPKIADALADVFWADWSFRDARPWVEVRDDVELHPVPAANGSYPSSFPPRVVRAERVDVLLAPDNAEPAVVALLDSAESSILIQQVSIGSRDHPFVNATIRAARRGVRVRVLLSGAWYVREDNRRMVEWLNDVGRREGLDLRARIVRPRSRFEKIHVKGVIVDREAAIVGSMNWNAYATRRNREVSLVLHGEEAAGYFVRVFRADWRGGVWQLPVGLGTGAAVAAVGVTTFLRRRIRFDRSAPKIGY